MAKKKSPSDIRNQALQKTKYMEVIEEAKRYPTSSSLNHQIFLLEELVNEFKGRNTQFKASHIISIKDFDVEEIKEKVVSIYKLIDEVRIKDEESGHRKTQMIISIALVVIPLAVSYGCNQQTKTELKNLENRQKELSTITESFSKHFTGSPEGLKTHPAAIQAIEQKETVIKTNDK